MPVPHDERLSPSDYRWKLDKGSLLRRALVDQSHDITPRVHKAKFIVS